MELWQTDLAGGLSQAHSLVFLGLLLLLSHFGGKVANYFNAPRVTGYLVIGILVSPSVLGVFHERLVKDELSLITDMALSIIAFSIGGSLGVAKLKKLGKQILWITCAEASSAFIAVTLLLLVTFGAFSALSSSFSTLQWPVALLIGALSAATAPAATLAIIHEYKARGPLTSVLLGVVALDDALAILFFAFASAVAAGLLQQTAVSWQQVVLVPGVSILLSLLLGGALGLGLQKAIRFVSRKKALPGMMIGTIFLLGGLAISLKASPLLANMSLGFVVTNFVERRDDMFAAVEEFEEPIFAMFFTLAGAHFDFRVIEAAGGLALLIILGRFVGKLLGSRVGARISGAPDCVRNYLGFALLPKAGVTVGLVLAAEEIFGPTLQAEVMINAVLGSVIINELLTPFFVRFALSRAGEIHQKQKAR
ncbi:Kef-type K+ transport system, membrane component KefB [Malonomonas rubra DSM 5091]|uniref:Kef-type K+ transport system, membrane component KefB n=1 Tax=Malonomonas rubra DSM 5091 TaxID=1122189 RepID=A0A1M6I501_MALRU|nr:cation:proton antiporter [Malonomonas rubra]SHJ29541.1 Kef-type K+ transport system, membrane component KefB [Malonomonas rubra DSM 5091]